MLSSERCIFSVCSMPLRPVCRARPASTRKKNKNWWWQAGKCSTDPFFCWLCGSETNHLKSAARQRRGRVFCCVERSLAWYTIYSRALPVEHEQTDLWEEYIRGKTDHYKSKTVGMILISFLSLLHSRQQLGGILSRSEQNL